MYFYDGSSPAASFSAFDAIPYVAEYNQTQSFYSFVNSTVGASGDVEAGKPRGTFSSLPTYGVSLKYLVAIRKETEVFMALFLTSIDY